MNNRSKQREWEEAVELDRLLEVERNQQSKARLVRQQEDAYNGYMDRINNPAMKNVSSGMSGILGPTGAFSPYMNKGMGSLPDLKQAKRESKFY